MNTDREVWVRQLMERFRLAARHPQAREHAGFFSFPSGSCTWASFAFGHLLAELEPEADWHLVNARGNHGAGHDWLESQGLAVDVTADQFEGYEPYVGHSPAPRPERCGRTQRIELDAWDPDHQDALGTIRALMELDP